MRGEDYEDAPAQSNRVILTTAVKGDQDQGERTIRALYPRYTRAVEGGGEEEKKGNMAGSIER